MKKNYFAFALLALLLLGSSCRPRQSAYRQVYDTTYWHEMQAPAALPALAITGGHPPVEVTVRHLSDEYVVRQESWWHEPAATTSVAPPVVGQGVPTFFPAAATHAPALGLYSVVVASLISRHSAETLQARLQRDGHTVIIASNELGMFRVIVGTFNDLASAVTQRERIRRQYAAKGNREVLMRRYGVGFDDLWILRR